MNYRILLFLMAGVAVGCGDDSSSNGTGGTGGSGQPTEVTIETFNLALAGSFVPYEQERRQPLMQAIANAEADILCLQEVWTQADKEMIRDAATGNYPNVVIFEDDIDTALNDATDQNDQVPPAPTTVPCPDVEVTPGITVEEQMDAAVECVALNCNTSTPDDLDGMTTSTACAGEFCTGDILGLLLGDDQQNRCYSCLVTQLPTATFREIGDSCPTVVNQELAFEGQNGVMILSRYPLKDAVDWVIPGTWNRRVILSATAELPNGSELDVYCNHLSPIFDDITLPYFGQYGDGMSGAAGWEAEQFLQAEKLIDYVKTTSGDTPAVILGDLNAGHDFSAEEIVAEGEPTLNLLESVFPPAYTTDYVPQCTFCITNPVTDPAPESVSAWIDHILLYNMTAESVIATNRTFDEDVVPVDDMMVPLSDHFGMQSVIRVP
jgi:endonuclease/exonuclease/phosphatase family metal-dependent hydrolase